MADITELALRAIISGLRRSGTIGEKDILAIMNELQRLADDCRDAHSRYESGQLMALASRIGSDARVGN